jgi:hypothetical protein
MYSLQDIGLHFDVVREIRILELWRKIESRELALAREKMQFEGYWVAFGCCQRDLNTKDVKKGQIQRTCNYKRENAVCRMLGSILDLVREIGILEMCRKVESRELALARENIQFAGCWVAWEIGILEMWRKIESRVALARENLQFAGCCVAGFDVVCVWERERDREREIQTCCHWEKSPNP